jgi:hypothetical protein
MKASIVNVDRTSDRGARRHAELAANEANAIDNLSRWVLSVAFALAFLLAGAARADDLTARLTEMQGRTAPPATLATAPVATTSWSPLERCMHKLKLGMSQADVEAGDRCRRPASTNTYGAGHTEQWRYEDERAGHLVFVYFTDGFVSDWQEVGK